MITTARTSTLRPVASLKSASHGPKQALASNPFTSARQVLPRKHASQVVKADNQDTPQDISRATQAAAEAAAGDLSPEQQKALGQIYQFLVQDVNSKARFDRNISLQRLVETYQVLLWRPAELLNGRMAMVGFTFGAARHAAFGETVWQQLATTGGFAYLFAYGLILLAGLLNRQFGGPTQGIGPFTQTAELINGRAAMVGYALMAYADYNTELSRKVFYLAQALAQQLAHGQIPNISA